MTKYRLKRNFNGTWDIQILEELLYYQYSEEQGKSIPITELKWRFYGTLPTYKEAVQHINNKLAEKAYVPIILEPPFPDQDPTKKSFFKSLFNFS